MPPQPTQERLRTSLEGEAQDAALQPGGTICGFLLGGSWLRLSLPPTPGDFLLGAGAAVLGVPDSRGPRQGQAERGKWPLRQPGSRATSAPP